MNGIRTWWRRRQFDKAQTLIESYGLSVVQLHEMAGDTYLIEADGQCWRLTRGNHVRDTNWRNA